ncbi:MAG: serine/threonine protein kinase [Oceanospirillaceae bacterium]|nr:serine/threonine protein kinase [Oceanospirillaceae bacterium]
MPGDLTEHFSRIEFRCKCGKCDFDTVDAGLVLMLEKIRRHFNRPVTITSACRCARHNQAVGGSTRSQHLYGRAADITVAGTQPADVADFAETLNPGGLGRYATFTHIDSRTIGPARWNG